MYSKEILQHFRHPQNVGMIEHADGFGKASGGERCPEDLVYIWIRVVNDRIVEVKQKTRGCPVAIAASSVTSVMAQGKTLAEAQQITPEMVIQALGGVPESKADSIVASQALREAIAHYQAKGR